MDSLNFRAGCRRYATDLNHTQPRSVTLVKDKSGFGFTLRHFIVYPPSNFNNTALNKKDTKKDSTVTEGEWKPMDTIFIREVKLDSPAHHAGLNKGDRIIAINSHALSGKSYSQIIHLILRSGQTLRLLVVPKEDDILQLYFASSAYQPVHRKNKQHKYLLPSFPSEQSNYGTYPGHNKSKSSERETFSGFNLSSDKDNLSSPPHLASGLDKKEEEFSLHEKYMLDTSCFSEDEGFFNQPKEIKSDNLVESPKNSVADFYYALCNDQPSVFSFSSEDNLNYPIYMSDFDDIVHCDNMAESKSITDSLHISEGSSYYQYDRPIDTQHSKCISDSPLAPCLLNNKDNVPHIDAGIVSNKPSEYDFRDNPHVPSINLVAQRKHQFESGNLLAESMERMKLYRSELSRMSKSNQAKIVSSRTAVFENKATSLCTEKESINSDKHISNDDNNDQLTSCKYGLLDHENSNKEVMEHILVCDAESFQNVETGDFNPCSAGVVHRRKTVPATADQDECHIVRRISYLRATANERMNIESDLSEEDETSNVSSPNKEYRIQKLKSFFGEKTPKVKEAIDINDVDNQAEQLKSVYGWVICKVVSLEGKRSSDRSWRHLWAILRDNILYLLKERREPSKGTLTTEEHVINMKYSIAKVASDYVKRKHVLRLLLLNGTEYLVQTESHNSMIDWLKALQIFSREMTELPEWLKNTSVLEKAKAYEQHLQINKGKTSTQPHTVRKLVFRHRTPSEHSIKSRRASHGDELALTKIGVLWRDRMLQGWKKVHNSHIPKGASFGVKLENAPSGITNEHIPLVVELCVQIVESRGLDMVGIYRVPGNNASVSILTDKVNQGIDDEVLKDSRWNDINIVSSLLKAYFRKLPEPLLTSHLYTKFIQASEIEDPVRRLQSIKHVLYHLPVHYFATLRFLMYHLKKVVEHSATNKMEARNLAIVFGPTLVRATDNNMIAMVTDMPQQCYLIETLITYVEWLFEDCNEPIEVNDRRKTHPPSTLQSSALLSNINKLDENADSLPHEMFASLYNAASRHLRHHQKKKDPISYSKKRSGIIADDTDIFSHPPITCDSKANESENLSDISFGSCSSLISGSNVSKQRSKELENGSSPPIAAEAVGHRYNKLSALAQEKIKNFEQETKALLRRDRPRVSVGTPQVEWEQIEKEWQKAKLELEQEDLLDYLADDPSYLSCLLSRGEELPKDVKFYPGKTEFPRSLSSGKELLSCQNARTANFILDTKSQLTDEISLENSRANSEKPEIPMSVSQPTLASLFSEKVAAIRPEEYSATSKASHSEESKLEYFRQMDIPHSTESSNPS